MGTATVALILSAAAVILAPALTLYIVFWTAEKQTGEYIFRLRVSANFFRLTRTVWGILLPLMAAFGIISGGLWLVTHLAPSSTSSTEASSNDAGFQLLSIVLTVAALFIAAVGGLAFVTLRRELAASIENTVSERVWNAVFRSWAFQAYTLTTQYERLGDQNLLKDASEVYASIESHISVLDERKSRDEQTLCMIRNNLGYLICLKPQSEVTKEEQAKALAYATYLENRLAKYPDRAAIWSDTIQQIRSKFGA